MHHTLGVWLCIVIAWVSSATLLAGSESLALVSRVGLEKSTEDVRNFASNDAFTSTPAAEHRKFAVEGHSLRVGLRKFFRIGPSQLFWGFGLERQSMSQLIRETSVLKTHLESTRVDGLFEVGTQNPLMGNVDLGYDFYAGMLLSGSARYSNRYDLDDFENETEELSMKSGRMVGGAVTLAMRIQPSLRLGIFVGYRMTATELKGSDDVLPSLYACSGPNGGLFLSF